MYWNCSLFASSYLSYCQVSPYTPCMVGTSTPIEDVNKTKNVRSLLQNIKSTHTTKVLSTSNPKILPSPINRDNGDKKSHILLGPFTATTASTYKFTGNEKPFVSRVKIVPAVSMDLSIPGEKKTTSQQNQSGHSGEERGKDLKRQLAADQTHKGTDLSVKPILPTISKEENSQTLPVLLPISPISQMRMEVEAGMKPSLPVNVAFQQGTVQFGTSPFTNNLQCAFGQRSMRPILGRKFNDAPAADLSSTESYKQFCAGIHRTILPAHSNHKLSSLAAQDSAIILPEKVQDENIQPIDLSKKTQNDYAKIWNQMTVKTNNNSTNFDKTGGSREANTSKVIENNVTTDSAAVEPSCSKKEKFTSSAVHAKSQNLRLQDKLVAWNEKHGKREKSEDTNIKEIVYVESRPESKGIFDVLKKELVGSSSPSNAANQDPVEEILKRNSKADFENVGKESLAKNQMKSENDGKFVIIANNSSTSTIPYGEDSTDPINLSCTKDPEQVRSLPAANKNYDLLCFSDDTNYAFFGVKGNAIKAKNEESIPAAYPLETSEGLMDSVFEEDMVKGDSDMGSPHSQQAETELSPSFRLYGNNIWEGPNHADDNSAVLSDGDSFVSDAEEGYMTCSTSLCRDATLESPIIDVHDSGRGYSAFRKRDTPSKVMKWLKCASNDVNQDVIVDIVNKITNEENDDSNKEETEYKRIILKGIQHMLIASDKLEQILAFGSQSETLSDIKSTPLASIIKAYMNATTRCINKIASILKNGPKTKAQSVKKDLNKMKYKKGKRPQQNMKSVKTGQLNKPSDKKKQERKVEAKNSSKQNQSPQTIDISYKTTELSPVEQTKYQGYPLIGAMDLVTSTPIDGNRYWKKRMLRQNLGENSTPSSLKKATGKNIDKTVPECRKGLLSASFSDDDDSAVPEVKLAWTPSCKVPCGLKMGSGKKDRSMGEKSYPYKKLKEIENKGTKTKRVGTKSTKRKRTKSSPTGISPTSNLTSKKTKNGSPSGVAVQVSSSNRRHFPYQNVIYQNDI